MWLRDRIRESVWIIAIVVFMVTLGGDSLKEGLLGGFATAGAVFLARWACLGIRRAWKRLWDPITGVKEPPPVHEPLAMVYDLGKLEWRGWEIIVSEWFSQLGYETALTPFGEDGGVDLWIRSENGLWIPVQVKARNEPVGVNIVREMGGVQRLRNVEEGWIISKSGFTRQAQMLAQSLNINLVSGENLIAELEALSLSAQRHIQRVVFAGQWTVPTCPGCGIKMRRVAGMSHADWFWGCPRYPRCRTTLKPSPGGTSLFWR